MLTVSTNVTTGINKIIAILPFGYFTARLSVHTHQTATIAHASGPKKTKQANFFTSVAELIAKA